MPYERKTVDIYISDDLKNVLKEIEGDSLVAQLLLKKRHDKGDVSEDFVNYISLSTQDNKRISYLTPDRIKALSEDEYWTSSRRYHAKPGSFISKVFKNIPPKEVEKFSLLFKAEVEKPPFTFEVVSGQRIKDLYYWESYASDRGPLGISCMKHEQCQKYLDIYADNKEVSMIAMFNDDGKLLGRALIWSFESYKLMDRIYTICDEEYSSYFKKWAVKNDILHKKEQNWFNTIFFEQFGQKQVELKLELKLQNNSYDYYPYMDTFKFIDDYGTLYNYQPDCRFRTLCSTDGHKQGSDYLRYDSIAKVFRYPGDTVWLEYRSIYTHHDYCSYSECNDQYILRDDATYCDDAQDYIFDKENEDRNNRDRINDRIEYNKQREEERKKYEESRKKKRSRSALLDELIESTINTDGTGSFYNMYSTFSDRLRRNGEEAPTQSQDTSEVTPTPSEEQSTRSITAEETRGTSWFSFDNYHSREERLQSGPTPPEPPIRSSSDDMDDILSEIDGL
jgi:hypothetical protein